MHSHPRPFFRFEGKKVLPKIDSKLESTFGGCGLILLLFPRLDITLFETGSSAITVDHLNKKKSASLCLEKFDSLAFSAFARIQTKKMIDSFFSHLSSTQSLILIFLSPVLLLVAYFLIPLAFSPLNKYPGPFAAATSRLWLAYHSRYGVRSVMVDVEHKRHGAFDVLSPLPLRFYFEFLPRFSEPPHSRVSLMTACIWSCGWMVNVQGNEADVPSINTNRYIRSNRSE